MIYIQRQTAPQSFLEIALRRHQLELLRDWLCLATAKRPAPPPMTPQYAAHAAVLEQMNREFLGKCAFCEQKLSADQQKLTFFRPLGQALQKPEKNGGLPDPYHYTWLIGDWSNLYLACEICRNRQGAEFPTQNARLQPELAHLERANAQPYFMAEQPLLIDPGVEAPAQHLAFTERGQMLPREGSEIGRKTIAIFDLNRESLQKLRAGEAQTFKALWQQAYALTCQGATNDGRLTALLGQLALACAGTPQFAGMKRHLLLEWIDYEKNAAATPQRVIDALNGPAWQNLVTRVRKLLYPANALLRLDRENTFFLAELVGIYTSAVPQSQDVQLQVMVLAGSHSEIVMGDRIAGDKVVGDKITVGNIKGSQVTIG